ncbi:TolB family protein [Pyxidicoccus caerfyrddinensis]|uniref:TolB family protein n=1 Tax=Pyxidicoccus caerfyrddinensis TaxID=2709663 RepID=UPI0013D8F136|nr:hypothetical protein [Pyxidicoccus caerfyrddinensis]
MSSILVPPCRRALALVLTGVALMLACDTAQKRDPPPDPIPSEPLPANGVLIAATATTLAPGKCATVSAFVASLELEDTEAARAVKWTLQGPGTFTPGDRRTVVYCADATSTGTATLLATSLAEPQLSASLELTLGTPSTDAIQTTLFNPVCFDLRCRSAWPTDDPARVLVKVESTYEVASVVARVPSAARQAALAPVPGSLGYFEATLDLHDVAPGAYLLEVVVTDTRGNTLVTPARFILDRPPRLVREAPVPERVAATTELPILATCTDDSGGCVLEVRVREAPDAAVVARATTRLDTVVDLSPYANRTVHLDLRVVDALAGWTRSPQAPVLATVVMNPALQRVRSVPGALLDADATRLLFGPRENATRPVGIAIMDRASGSVVTAPAPAKDAMLQDWWLTSSGAVLRLTEGPDRTSKNTVYSLRADTGELTALEPDLSASSLRAAGDYAIWGVFPGFPGIHHLKVHRLSTGATTDLGPNSNAYNSDVAETGLVAYWGGNSDIFTYRDGETRQLTDDADPVRNIYPRTDGTRVVFQHGAVDLPFLMLWTGASLETLTQNRNAYASPGRDYEVRAGWIAYTDAVNNGPKQVWLRSPTGEVRKLTDFGTSSYIEALTAEGRVAVRTGVAPQERLLVSRADGTLQDLGPVAGRALWLDGAWHVLWADTLFRVVP